MEEINNLLCKIEYIIDETFNKCLEKDQMLVKLRELIFWITYYEDRRNDNE